MYMKHQPHLRPLLFPKFSGLSFMHRPWDPHIRSATPLFHSDSCQEPEIFSSLLHDVFPWHVEGTVYLPYTSNFGCFILNFISFYTTFYNSIKSYYQMLLSVYSYKSQVIVIPKKLLSNGDHLGMVDSWQVW